MNTEIFKHAKDVVNLLGRVVAYGVVLEACNGFVVTKAIRNKYVTVGYYDAVSAIMKSGMFAGDKQNAVAAMKRDGSSDYYKTVIDIIKTGMFAGDKIKAIEALG